MNTDFTEGNKGNERAGEDLRRDDNLHGRGNIEGRRH